MAVVRDASLAQLTFQVTGRPLDEFDVVRYRGTEGLSQLYRFEINLVARGTPPPLADIVGKSACLSINATANVRVFHGIVSRFEVCGESTDQTIYRVELVPNVWLMTQRYNSRIFQNKTTPQIIQEVLKHAGIASDRVKTILKGDYKPREYCVQYRETDYNFISRLMEDEGIWWYFEHTKDSHTLFLEDGASAYKQLTGDPKLEYLDPSGMQAGAEHIFRFRLAQSVRPGGVVLTDFDFKKPTTDLESKADNGRDKTLEFIDAPGGFVEQAAGDKLAKIRAEEFESNRIQGIGQSSCSRMQPGRVFELTKHPTAACNGKYLITTVTHEGKESVKRTTTGSNGRWGVIDARSHQALITARGSENPQIRELADALLQISDRLRAGDPTARRSLTEWLYHAGQVARDLPAVAAASGASPLSWVSVPNLVGDVASDSIVDYDAPIYACRFDCVPEAVKYRPARITPWPVARGSQTARVVGPDGEEIHCDEFGRVRVQFHWDREGSEGGQPKRHGSESSCFIRVAQGMAGGGYGMLFLPRVGQEVIVDFLEGDIDKPVIVGRLNNADHMPAYKLPDEKTKSYIKTNTTKGGGGTNEIRFEDLKDKEQLLIQAQRRMDTMVKATHFHTAGSYHLLVGGEKDGELHGEYRQKVFKLKQTHVKGEQRTWVEDNDGLIVAKDQSIEIQGSRATSVGGEVVDLFQANHQHEVTSTYHCKAASIKLEAGTIELVSGGNKVVVASDGVYITGTMVYINSGAGPSVAPPNLNASGPAALDEPGGAESTKPGKDKRYGGPSGAAQDTPTLPEVPGNDFPEPPPKPRTSFIEVELVDELGNPIAGEPFDLTTPDGFIRSSRTGVNGKSKITGIVAGMCKIKFTRLDLEAWQRST